MDTQLLNKKKTKIGENVQVEATNQTVSLCGGPGDGFGGPAGDGFRVFFPFPFLWLRKLRKSTRGPP